MRNNSKHGFPVNRSYATWLLEATKDHTKAIEKIPQLMLYSVI